MLIDTCEKAGKLITKAQSRQQLYLDRKLSESPHQIFQIGNVVLLHQTRMENQMSGKLEDKWQGPYYIHDILGNGSYKLHRKDGIILSKSIHGNHLKLYQNSTSIFIFKNIDE